MGRDYTIPNLPGGKLPHASQWLDTLHEVISESDKPLVLVGHSLGTRAALLYLEKYVPEQVAHVFLVAAFSNRLENGQRRDGEAYPDFFTHEVDVSEVKEIANHFYVLHSKDDYSIPYEQGLEIAGELDAEMITFEDRSHFYKPENAQIIFNLLKQKLLINNV